MSAEKTTNQHNWEEALTVYLHPRVVAMLFLGFTAGLPLLLIFSTLSLWLREAGVERSSVTYFSWAALAYSFKFVWAPVIDKLPLPVLHKMFGRRRSWLLVAQVAIMLAMILMAMTDPAKDLSGMVVAVVLLGFASASQDIVIDAYRIEAVKEEYQAAMSAMYIAGYRLGMLMSGAVALYIAAYFGSEHEYIYSSWRITYLCMAATMLVGVVTTLLISEPEASKSTKTYLHDLSDYLRFFVLFLSLTASFVFAFIQLDDMFFSGFWSEATRLLLSLLVALAAAKLLMMFDVVKSELVDVTYIDPVKDFFRRYGGIALLILLLVGFYRVSDIVLGVISNVFYQDMGFTKEQIATTTKVFGLFMTLLGGFLGGMLTMCYGVMRILLLGAILSAVTNLLFMWLAYAGNDIYLLSFVIAADNLSAGLASAAFIAYLSGLTNISFTAVQYAILSSLMTLFPKLLGGYSGSMVDSLNYQNFFLLTAVMGVPVILLIIYLMKNEHTSVKH